MVLRRIILLSTNLQVVVLDVQLDPNRAIFRDHLTHPFVSYQIIFTHRFRIDFTSYDKLKAKWIIFQHTRNKMAYIYVFTLV